MVAFYDPGLDNRIAAIETLFEIGVDSDWLREQMEHSTAAVDILSDNILLTKAISQSNLTDDQIQLLMGMNRTANRIIYAPFSSETVAIWAETLEIGEEKELNAALFALQRMEGPGGWEAIAPLRRIALSQIHPPQQRLSALDALLRIAINNRSHPGAEQQDWTSVTAVDAMESCLEETNDEIGIGAAVRIMCVAHPPIVQRDPSDRGVTSSKEDSRTC